MKNEVKLADLLRSSAARMWHDLNERFVPHPAERGRDREAVLRDFLAQYLPERVGVSTGFVFDSSGRTSKQVDVIIYDRLYSPTFPSAGGTRLFPCESVLCVGEAKSNLGSREELAGALENVKSVKCLDRAGDGDNCDPITGRPIEPVSNHLDQIFAFVFAVKSDLAPDTIRQVLADHINEEERHLWPNVVFVFDRALVTYACPNGVCPNPMHALGIAEVAAGGRAELLLSFFLKVAMAVQVTSLGGFRYSGYLWNETATAGTIHYFKSAANITAE